MIEFMDPKSLLPHEDIDIHNLNKVTNCIKHSKSMQPVIVDENSLLILDGHHRVRSSIMLGIKKIPVYFVNYSDERIKVNSFALNIRKMELALKLIGNGKNDVNCVNISLSKYICANSLYKLYWKINFIQSYLKNLGFTVIKTEKDGIPLPRLEKEYVIDIAKKSLRFPPKTTRHTYEFIIPHDRITVNEFL